jgi:hypothetical protein
MTASPLPAAGSGVADLSEEKMTRASVSLGVVLLSGPTLAQTDSPDGIWRFQERFCIKQGSAPRRCSRGSEQFMFNAELAYYGGSFGNDWREVGTVAVNGRRLVLTVTPKGLASLINGVDAEDVLGAFSFAYSGILRGRRLINGRMHATIDLAVPGRTYAIRGRGTFVAKRIGEVCCLEPPSYDEAFSNALGGGGSAPSAAATGAIGGTAATLTAASCAP